MRLLTRWAGSTSEQQQPHDKMVGLITNRRLVITESLSCSKANIYWEMQLGGGGRKQMKEGLKAANMFEFFQDVRQQLGYVRVQLGSLPDQEPLARHWREGEPESRYPSTHE